MVPRDGRGPGVVAVAVLAATLVVVVVLLVSGGGGYTVKADFVSASQLVAGNAVKVSGNAIGSVDDISLTDDGKARVTMQIDGDGFHPLRRGTRATIRQSSLSGVANRYVDLQLGGADRAEIPDGGTLPASNTAAAVDLDQIFDTFDPEARRGRAEERRVPARLPGRQRGGGQRGVALPQPGAVELGAPVRRARSQHAGLRAVHRRDRAPRDRRVGAGQRACRPHPQPRARRRPR